jgi:hypothetical protein
MEIKIDCSCGTRYGFEVEPENGRMPAEVACPTCGLDGTRAANAQIQERLGGAGNVRPMRIHLGGHTPARSPVINPPAVAAARGGDDPGDAPATSGRPPDR